MIQILVAMDNDLRTVATFASPMEAALARNTLEALGIDAVIADELTLTADPLLHGAIGYIKVQVRESDVERAVEILNDPSESVEPEPAEGSDEIPVDSAGERLVRFAYHSAIMGLIACPPIMHMYSLALLLWIGVKHPDLPPNANRKYWIALAIDLIVLAVAALFVRVVILGRE